GPSPASACSRARARSVPCGYLRSVLSVAAGAQGVRHHLDDSIRSLGALERVEVDQLDQEEVEQGKEAVDRVLGGLGKEVLAEWVDLQVAGMQAKCLVVVSFSHGHVVGVPAVRGDMKRLVRRRCAHAGERAEQAERVAERRVDNAGLAIVRYQEVVAGVRASRGTLR